MPDITGCPGLEDITGPVQSMWRLSGSNNPVWHVTGRDRQAVLKFYGMPDDPDAVARYQRETGWLAASPLLPQPELLACWPGVLACLQEFVGTGGACDRKSVLTGLKTGLVALSRSVGAPETSRLPDARDNALVPATLASQLQRRLDGFAAVQDPEFSALWRNKVLPVATRLLADARNWSGDALPAGAQIASPSDIGGHNMIGGHDGMPVFVDFEFAGRDDPAMLVLDTLLHEHDGWTPVEKFILLDGIGGYFEQMPGFVARLFRYWPMGQMIWILIALNPWRAAHASRIGAAGIANIDDLRQARLARAEYLLDRFDEERQLSGDLIANIF